MDESRNQNGAGVALLALVLVVLLVVAVAAYYWLVIVRASQARALQAQAMLESDRAAAEAAARQRRVEEDATGGSAAADEAIREMLQTQLDAWNEGDLDGFMRHYWKSDQLTFSSGNELTRGWQSTLESYRQRYPSAEEMGQTTFDNLDISLLAPTAALVLGDWRLQRDSGELSGKFSLVLRWIDGRWVIVHDHTSRASDP